MKKNLTREQRRQRYFQITQAAIAVGTILVVLVLWWCLWRSLL